MKVEDLYVKEVIKTTKDKDEGIQTTYKAVLEQIGSTDIKIVVTSSEPIKMLQGDKGLKLTNKKPRQTKS